MQGLIDKYLRVTGTCPECGSEMFEWRQTRADGSPRCQPVCMTCGYYAKGKKAQPQTDFSESFKSKGIKAVRNWSEVPSKSYFDKNFGNFEADDDKLNSLLLKSKLQARDLVHEPIHVLYTGTTGTGKSHLAMAVLWEYLELTDYHKKAIFVSTQEYIEHKKMIMNINDQQTQDEFNQLTRIIKTADLVVLDDLGAENGQMENVSSATRFNVQTISELINAREDKGLIVTTNLNAQAIIDMYGERVYSRLMTNTKDHIFVMKDIKDHRIKSLTA